MLQEIRERAQGWVAWAIVILISIPFAFWGIDSYLGGGATPFVAKVNGTEITERAFSQSVQRTRIELRDRLGDAYDPALFGGERIREQVLERMIRDAVLLDASADMGLRVSDEAVRAAILSEPFFQVDGVFSKEAYERALRLQGLTPAAYEDSLRSRLLSTQLPRAVDDTEFVTDAALANATRLLRQRRQLTYVRLPQGDFTPEAPPTEAEIQAYYDEHRDAFATPEQVRISYLLLDAKALAVAEGQADEDELRVRYEARIDEFTEPEERRLRHILLTLPTDADESEAAETRDRMAEIRERILAGEDFAEVAAEVSEDPASANQGGELGLVGRGLLDPAFEQAAFSLAPETLSEPVRSRFGYHLIEVLEVQGGEPAPFEEVRDQLVAEVGSGRAEAIFFEQAEQLATLTYESPDSLIPAAEALDLEVQTTDWLDREGAEEGLFGLPKVLAAAFSEDVLTRGNNSELIEPDPDALQALVLRVDEHRPPDVKPLDEVRDDIVSQLNAERAAEAALAAAEDLVEQLRGGADLSEAAGDYSIERPGLVERAAAGIPPAVLTLGFSAVRPVQGDATYVSGPASDGDALVVAVSAVEDGDATALDAPEMRTEARVLSQALARAGVTAMLEDLESRANIERRELRTTEEF